MLGAFSVIVTTLFWIVVGHFGRELEQAQRPRARHTAAAYARSSRRVLEQVPDARQTTWLSVHAAQAQRRKQPVRKTILCMRIERTNYPNWPWKEMI